MCIAVNLSPSGPDFPLGRQSASDSTQLKLPGSPQKHAWRPHAEIHTATSWICLTDSMKDSCRLVADPGSFVRLSRGRFLNESIATSLNFPLVTGPIVKGKRLPYSERRESHRAVQQAAPSSFLVLISAPDATPPRSWLPSVRTLKRLRQPDANTHYAPATKTGAIQDFSPVTGRCPCGYVKQAPVWKLKTWRDSLSSLVA